MDVRGEEEKQRYRLVLGQSEDDELEQELPIITDLSQRHEHHYIAGRGGRGKSSLMERMALTDLYYGLSIIFIDPKGDTVKRLHYNAPDKSKVRYLSMKNPMGINPLQRNISLKIRIDEYVKLNDVFTTKTASNPESTTLMREILTNTIKVLRPDELNTYDLIKYLRHQKYRDAIRARGKFKTKALSDWWNEYDWKDGWKHINGERVDSAKRMANRLQLASDGMETFLQDGCELNIGRMMEQGDSLLVNLSGMSDEVATFIPILITQLVNTYLQYEKYSKNTMIVYADEFHEYTNKYFEKILTRGRSENIGFTLAHHDFAQIDVREMDTILGVVNSFSIFNCSSKVASYMADIFDIPKKEFIKLKKFYCWTRLGTDISYMSLYDPIPIAPPDYSPPSPVEFNFLRNDWF